MELIIACLLSVALGFVLGFIYAKNKKNINIGNVGAEDDNNEDSFYSDNCSFDYKMVFVVRQDLKMTKGKAAAQCCHAAIDLYNKAKKNHPDWVSTWQRSGCAKIALKCQDEETLLALHAHARVVGLDSRVIMDAGRTQIASGSKTVIGIGPAPVALIDKVTSHLKLY